ncbi:MAG: hypothetical protein J6T47_09820, partial [Lachnospiraceae bacterium]|nr:hypothetical protein [Lachnospiraceae bacterium]
MGRGKLGKKLSALIMSTAMVLTMIPFGGMGRQTVEAASSEKTIAGLSTTPIKAPESTVTYDSEGRRIPWVGSYVWYGKYEGEPVKYRVLSPKTTEYGGTSMFLDCDSILYQAVYDEDCKPNDGQTNPNEWEGSDLQYSLNGMNFLWKKNVFTTPERDAIIGSKIASHSRAYDTEASRCLYSPINDFDDFVGLNGEQIFVLDIGEMIPKYGYFHPQKDSLNGEHWMWWTRSAHAPTSTTYGTCVGYVPNLVYSYGTVNAAYGKGYSSPIGASPAFNVNLNRVIFSSVVSGTAGENDAEYKLTLRDNSLGLTFVPASNGVSASAVVGPVKTDVSMRLQAFGGSQDDVTRLSVLILDKGYTYGNSNKANILYYGKMVVPGDFSTIKTTATALFSLPSNLSVDDWDSKFFVYVLAEIENGPHESDYASDPLQLKKPKISYTSAPPEILTQPTTESVYVDEVAQFKVVAKEKGPQPLIYQWQYLNKATGYLWANYKGSGSNPNILPVTGTTELDGTQFRCVIKDYTGLETISNVVTLTIKADQSKTIKSAKAKDSSIAKTAAQEFTVETTADVKNLMLYAEGGSPLVKTWAASGNSTVSGNTRTWKVTHAINTAGDRKLVFKGGTTDTTPVTNAVTVSFKVLNTGVISASAKNAMILKGGEQTFTVKTTSDAKYLMEYAEGENLVKTWTASSSNSTVSGNVRTWTVSQNIANAGETGERTLTFKAGTTSTPTAAQRTVAFFVDDVFVNSASVKYATIGKGGTQIFTVTTTSNAKHLELFGEGGNLVQVWYAFASSTVSGDVRTWTVSHNIGTVGNRELKLKASKYEGGGLSEKTVKFAVVEKKIVSASAKYAAITKSSVQGFTVTTSADVQYLMLYAEDGKTLVKSWAASGNSTVDANKIRTWYVMQAINTAGNRKLVFKGGTNNTTAVTNALTVSFKVESLGALSASAKYPMILKGGEQVFIVKTTSDSKYLVEYAEDGTTVKTWTASSTNSTVSGGVRTWTLPQTINTAGNRKLNFKAGGSSTTLTGAQVSAEFTVTASVKINATNFPDEAFRNYVKTTFDTNQNDEFSADELREIKELYIYRKGICTLKGIEFFSELKVLKAFSNPIEELDVSRNIKLEELDCSAMLLTSLDLSRNSELTYLECGFNKLNTLDLSKNKNLVTLYCASTGLTSLDVSGNTKLESLYAYSNNLTSLDVSKCTMLVYFHCLDNKLTSLNVRSNLALKELACYSNNLTSLDVSKNTALTKLTVDTGVTVTGAD